MFTSDFFLGCIGPQWGIVQKHTNNNILTLLVEVGELKRREPDEVFMGAMNNFEVSTNKARTLGIQNVAKVATSQIKRLADLGNTNPTF